MQFRGTLNNFINASIKKFPNEIAYEMKLNKELDIFNVIIQNQINIIDDRNKYRREAVNALVFTTFNTKTRYDNRHKIIKMKFDDKTYIKLYKKYHLSELKNAKLFN